MGIVEGGKWGKKKYLGGGGAPGSKVVFYPMFCPARCGTMGNVCSKRDLKN